MPSCSVLRLFLDTMPAGCACWMCLLDVPLPAAIHPPAHTKLAGGVAGGGDHADAAHCKWAAALQGGKGMGCEGSGVSSSAQQARSIGTPACITPTLLFPACIA